MPTMLPHRPRVAGRSAGCLFVVYLFDFYRCEKFSVYLSNFDALLSKNFSLSARLRLLCLNYTLFCVHCQVISKEKVHKYAFYIL